MSVVNIDEKGLKEGLLGLVLALVEIIKEALRLEAVRRMESGSLAEEEVDRLGEALMDLDAAIDKIKMDLGVTESVKAVRDGLDRVVEDALDTILNPPLWERAEPAG
ncbi:MAG: gas vesicle protein K [Chloroflexi bacterium]|nr:gas vesicle protein K [Chloroflexota bacterium]